MAETNNLEKAKSTFATFCQTLDNHGLHYDKNEEKLTIHCGVQGEDLPIEINVEVDPERMLAVLVSHVPLVVAEDKRLDLAIAICEVNNSIVDGSFDYDLTSGNIFFRMTNSFIDSKMGEAAFTYMLFCSVQTIDEFNDKFLMLAKGMITIEQFITSLGN